MDVKYIQCLFIVVALTSTKIILAVSDDLTLCMAENSSTMRFEVLPGGGWDNLANENRGRVVSYNYSECTITEDGIYVIPNAIDVIPLKSSKVHIYADRFDHWMNYTSETSKSINIGGDGSISGVFHIGGKFSHDYEDVKSNQVNDDALTIRVGARYEMYNAKLRPVTFLNPTFRNKVINIAHHIQFQRQDSVRYESQLLIRDYGTHIITSVDAGAVISRRDSINRTSSAKAAMTKSDLALAASFSFFGKGIDIGISSSVSDAMVSQYLQSRSHATVSSHGGPVYKPLNFSVNEWVEGINNNLVPIDRRGDPLHYLITSDLFPELPTSTLSEVAFAIEMAIVSYYNYNTHHGCTNIESPNFNFQANVDDGSCEVPGQNQSFGGIFQNCNFSGDTSNMCTSRTSVNPKTGAMTCPEGYDAVLLYHGTASNTEIDHQCEPFMIFWKKCHDVPRFGSAVYDSYWCAAHDHDVPPQSGYLFGGMYDSIRVNPITMNHNCPSFFYPLSIADNLKICVSDDFENGERYSVPFGGLSSCQHGNPLANTYYTPNNIPKMCPVGYSQHLATINKECEINYCTQMRSFTSRSTIQLKIPPFIKRPEERNDTESYIITETKQSWTRIYTVPENFTGFSGILSDWVIEDGSYLNIASLLNAKKEDTPSFAYGIFHKTVSENVQGFSRRADTALNEPDTQSVVNDENSNGSHEPDSLSSNEILAISGISSLITLFSIAFFIMLVVIYKRVLVY